MMVIASIAAAALVVIAVALACKLALEMGSDRARVEAAQQRLSEHLTELHQAIADESELIESFRTDMAKVQRDLRTAKDDLTQLFDHTKARRNRV